MRIPFRSARRARQFIAALLFGCSLALFNSCSWSLGDLNPQFHQSDDVSASYEQIRLRMRSLVDPMGGQIEASADKIFETHSDPGIKRAALEWKAQGVPALRESLFQPEPATALFDTWVLLFQMEGFYQSGNGAKTLGSASSQAVSTIQRMESDYQKVVQDFTVSKDVRKGREFARDWANQHPIQNSISYRESTLTRSTQVEMPDKFSASNAIADMTLTVDDLNRRIEIYSDQVVRQARWEAQLLTMDLSDQLNLDQAVPLASSAVTEVGNVADSIDQLAESIELLVPIVDRVARVTESTPQLIATERSVAIEAAQNEITRAIKTVEKERSITLEHITEERLAALQTLQQTISEERQIMIEEVRTISSQLVDHSLDRVTQLVIGILIAIILILLVGLFLVRQMIAGLIIKQAETRITN
ncbi:hypothetical protein [Haloferula sp.]|uniref:hypothetical protein n=1 Tax=Haloferula sp. TaxID=2497595 RepID=UPI00329EEECB